MFVKPLIASSVVLEVAGGAAALLAPFPSRGFSLAMQAVGVGLVSALFAIVIYQRRAIDAAFDLGVEVGERRGRRTAKPVLISLDGRRGRADAG